MIAYEKDQLLALLDHGRGWCQDAEAHDAGGNPVRFDDATAVAWDITGALCRLFGWRRARDLFMQLDRHVHGRKTAARWPARDAHIESMVALQNFNDHADTTFEILQGQIESMPIRSGNVSIAGPAPEQKGGSPVDPN